MQFIPARSQPVSGISCNQIVKFAYRNNETNDCTVNNRLDKKVSNRRRIADVKWQQKWQKCTKVSGSGNRNNINNYICHSKQNDSNRGNQKNENDKNGLLNSVGRQNSSAQLRNLVSLTIFFIVFITQQQQHVASAVGVLRFADGAGNYGIVTEVCDVYAVYIFIQHLLIFCDLNYFFK